MSLFFIHLFFCVFCFFLGIDLFFRFFIVFLHHSFIHFFSIYSFIFHLCIYFFIFSFIHVYFHLFIPSLTFNFKRKHFLCIKFPFIPILFLYLNIFLTIRYSCILCLQISSGTYVKMATALLNMKYVCAYIRPAIYNQVTINQP